MEILLSLLITLYIAYIEAKNYSFGNIVFSFLLVGCCCCCFHWVNCFFFLFLANEFIFCENDANFEDSQDLYSTMTELPSEVQNVVEKINFDLPITVGEEHYEHACFRYNGNSCIEKYIKIMFNYR